MQHQGTRKIRVGTWKKFTTVPEHFAVKPNTLLLSDSSIGTRPVFQEATHPCPECTSSDPRLLGHCAIAGLIVVVPQCASPQGPRDSPAWGDRPTRIPSRWTLASHQRISSREFPAVGVPNKGKISKLFIKIVLRNEGMRTN